MIWFSVAVSAFVAWFFVKNEAGWVRRVVAVLAGGVLGAATAFGLGLMSLSSPRFADLVYIMGDTAARDVVEATTKNAIMSSVAVAIAVGLFARKS